jgi:uncharacterized protein
VVDRSASPNGPRSTWLRRILVAIGVLIVLGYLGAVGYLVRQEKAFIYQPGERRVWPPARQFALHERTVSYPSTGGVTLTAWIVPSASDHPSDAWLLICHGNYGNVGFGQRPEYYALMRDQGINLFAFDYRGFGDSTGTPDERGLYEDATASYEYVTRVLGIPPSHVVIYGHSLGSGVAIELAARVPSAGLILEGAYTSVVRQGQERYPLLPIGLLATQRFPSIDRISSIHSPKLFLHSPEDAVIPYADGRRLFAAATEPKRFVDVRGGHENAYRGDTAVYFSAVAALMHDAVRQAGLAASTTR